MLSVEDNQFNRKIVRQLLGRTSYRLIETTDGEPDVTTARKAVPDLSVITFLPSPATRRRPGPPGPAPASPAKLAPHRAGAEAYNDRGASFARVTKGGGTMAKGTGMRKEKKKPKKKEKK